MNTYTHKVLILLITMEIKNQYFILKELLILINHLM